MSTEFVQISHSQRVRTRTHKRGSTKPSASRSASPQGPGPLGRALAHVALAPVRVRAANPFSGASASEHGAKAHPCGASESPLRRRRWSSLKPRSPGSAAGGGRASERDAPSGRTVTVTGSPGRAPLPNTRQLQWERRTRTVCDDRGNGRRKRAKSRQTNQLRTHAAAPRLMAAR